VTASAPFFSGASLPPCRRGRAGPSAGALLHVPAEFQVIRKNQIGQSMEIPLQLVVFLPVIQVLAYVFGLKVANRHGAVSRHAGNHEVGGSAFNALRLVCGGDLRSERFKKGFQRRAVGVLRGIACL